MHPPPLGRRLLRRLVLLLPLASFAACNSPAGVAAGALAVTAFTARAPTQSIEQTYYVGIFDPLEQLPPAVYRLTVRGQASAISNLRFASGWVPGILADGLGSQLSISGAGKASVTGDPSTQSVFASSRRMMMFGPEGFREAPKDHRLAIVMGTSPQEFFDAMHASLAAVVDIHQEQLDSDGSRMILEELYRLQEERGEVEALGARFSATRSAEERQ